MPFNARAVDAVAAITIAMLAPSLGAATAASAATVTNPVNGCTYTVSGPNFRGGGDPDHPLPKIEGGIGESVSCP